MAIELCKASAKEVRVSAYKVRPIADLIRGKSCFQVLGYLSHMPNKGARIIYKLIKSVMANYAQQKENVDSQDLYIKEIYVNQAYSRVRVRPRGRGHADRQLRRYAHIVLAVGKKG